MGRPTPESATQAVLAKLDEEVEDLSRFEYQDVLQALQSEIVIQLEAVADDIRNAGGDE